MCERLSCARKAALVLGSSQRKNKNKCEFQGAVFSPMKCGLAGLEEVASIGNGGHPLLEVPKPCWVVAD